MSEFEGLELSWLVAAAHRYTPYADCWMWSATAPVERDANGVAIPVEVDRFDVIDQLKHYGVTAQKVRNIRK